jgi:Protein of unknown function (DUF3147)
VAVRFRFSGLRELGWNECVFRFALGGLATVLAGVTGDVWGPAIGGLFLAVPSIFFASATLIEKHERERKEKKGLKGRERGKNAAALDAAGAGLGSVGLAAFGAVMWLCAREAAVGSLALATAAWFVVATLLWRARRQARIVRT